MSAILESEYIPIGLGKEVMGDLEYEEARIG